MSEPRQPKRRRFGDEQRSRQEAEKRWRAAYEPEVVERLRWDQRYSIIRIGDVELAFSDYDRYMEALQAAWDAGLVPDHGPSSVLGSDLPEVAPALRAVDPDLAASDVLGPEP